MFTGTKDVVQLTTNLQNKDQGDLLYVASRSSFFLSDATIFVLSLFWILSLVWILGWIPSQQPDEHYTKPQPQYPTD